MWAHVHRPQRHRGLLLGAVPGRGAPGRAVTRQLALVGSPRRTIGRHERAAERVLTRWRSDGHELDEVTSSALRAAGRAVDHAEADHADERASAYAVARTVAVWWTIYRDAAPDRVEVEVDDLDDLPADLDLDADD